MKQIEFKIKAPIVSPIFTAYFPNGDEWMPKKRHFGLFDNRDGWDMMMSEEGTMLFANSIISRNLPVLGWDL